MANIPKNIVNQYSYNSPYIKTLTKKQFTALYPTNSVIPKGLIFRIIDENENNAIYYIIGTGNSQDYSSFSNLVKIGQTIKVGDLLYNPSTIKFSNQYFNNNGGTITLKNIPTSQEVNALKEAIGSSLIEFMSSNKRIYLGDQFVTINDLSDEFYNMTPTEEYKYYYEPKYNEESGIIEYIAVSFFLYVLLNIVYNGKYENNKPLSFYTFSPISTLDTIKIELSEKSAGLIINPIVFDDVIYDLTTNSWIQEKTENNNTYKILLYFNPITSLGENNIYNLVSFYPYMYIKYTENGIESDKYNNVVVYNLDNHNNNPTNASIYFIVGSNEKDGNFTSVLYLSSSIINNIITDKNNSGGSGSSIDENTVYDLIDRAIENRTNTYKEWFIDPNNSNPTNKVSLKELIKLIGNEYDKDISTIQNDYVKKPNKAQQTEEDPELWTTISGTYVDQDNNNTTGTYEFKVLDYKIPSSNLE